MSQVKTVESMFERLRAGDVESVCALVAPDGEFRQAPSLPWAGSWVGPERVAAMAQRMFAAAILQVDDVVFHETGGAVLALVQGSFTSTATGRVLPMTFAEFYTVHDDLITGCDPIYKDTGLVCDLVAEGDPSFASRDSFEPAPAGWAAGPVVPTSSVPVTAEMAVMYRFFEYFNIGDLAAVTNLVAEDGTFHEAATLPWGGDWTGPGGFGKLLDCMLGLAELTIDSATIEQAGDRVAVRMDSAFTSRTTGKRVHIPMVELYTIRDEHIVDADVFYSDTAAVRALCGSGGRT